MSQQMNSPTPKKRPKQSRRPPPQTGKANYEESLSAGAPGRSSVAGHTSDSAAMESPSKQSKAPSTPSASRKRNGRGDQKNVHRGPQHEYNSDSGVPQQKHYSPSRSVSHSVDMTNGIAGYSGPGTTHLGGDAPHNSYLRSPPNVRTPAKQVYAGPNFLASPAPSSLPMPRAFSKSVPSVATRDQVHLSSQEEGDEDEASATDNSGEPVSDTPTAPAHSQSPLDVFFNADRAERSRQASHSESPLSSARPSAGVTEKEGRSRSVPQPSPSSTRNLTNGASRGGVFQMERNDFAHQPDGASSSPVSSYQQRMESLRRPSAQRPDSRPVTQDNDLQRQAKTRALKQMLMSPAEERAEPLPTTLTASGHNLQPSPQRSLGDSNSSNGTDIRKMEEHLRRMLNLGS